MFLSAQVSIIQDLHWKCEKKLDNSLMGKEFQGNKKGIHQQVSCMAVFMVC